jgi:hypothetical protein
MALVTAVEELESHSLRRLTATIHSTTYHVRDLCEKVKEELLMADPLTASENNNWAEAFLISVREEHT